MCNNRVVIKTIIGYKINYAGRNERMEAICSSFKIDVHGLIDGMNLSPDVCDTPNPGGLLTTRQPAETLVNVG